MTEIIEMGTVSSRGQICIPNGIRREMGLKEGSKILFVLEKDSLLVKRVSTETFAQITKPLKKEAEKSNIKESDVNRIIHNSRKLKK